MRLIITITILLCAAGAGWCAQGGDGGRGGDGGQIQISLPSPAEVAAVIDELTPEQRALVHQAAADPDFLGLQKPVDADTALAVVAYGLRDPEQRSRFLADLPRQLKEAHRRKDPLAVLPEDRAAAAALPATAAGEIEIVATGDAASAAHAWLRVEALGAAARAPLLDRARALPDGSAGRLRLLDLVQSLTAADDLAHALRALEDAQAAGARAGAGAVALVARQAVAAIEARRGAIANWCYYSFPKHAHGYAGEVSLMYGNGERRFSVEMYGGQRSELVDVGEHAPPPGDWPAALAAAKVETGERDLPAVAGHLYVEHQLEDGVDLVIAFRVSEVTDDFVVIMPEAPVR